MIRKPTATPRAQASIRRNASHCLRHLDAGAHPRVAMLCEGLAQHGHDVIECNVPLRVNTAARVAMVREERGLASFVRELIRCWLTLARRRWRLPPAQAVIVGHMGHFDVHLARILFPRTPLVLDHPISAGDTARDRGEQGRVRLASVIGAGTGGARCVRHRRRGHGRAPAVVPAQVVGKSVVVAVGAAGSWFRAGDARHSASSHAPAGREEPLKIVFFGLYTPLQGTLIIGRALSQLVDCSIEVTMIGDGQDRPAAAAAVRGGPPSGGWTGCHHTNYPASWPLTTSVLAFSARRPRPSASYRTRCSRAPPRDALS